MTETLIPPIEESRADLDRLDLRTRMFIDGAFRDAASGDRFVTENPATGRPITDVAQGGPADVDIAVAAARRAADDGRWSRLDPGARKRVLIAWADLIEANARELGLIETIDAGKPITDTVGLDMPETAACIRWHAEAADKLYGQVAPSPEGTIATITREPFGVVGAVIPWNYPAQMAAWKLGPALATGQHGRHQARLDDLAQPAADRASSAARPASPTGSSTSSPDRATPSARRSAATPTSIASRSRARPRSVGGSSTTRPIPTSSASCSSSAARARRSCSPT